MEIKQYRVLVRLYKFYNDVYLLKGRRYAYLKEKSQRTQVTELLTQRKS